jgi:CsoR family transcriptional regulator, copper-sensing transcriptional repressor
MQVKVLYESNTMKMKDQEIKKKLIQRLRRIEGQVRGVVGMLEDERDCHEIVQQLAAIHSAVEGTGRVFLQEYATACLMEMDEEEQGMPRTDIRLKREKIVQDMIALFDKVP